VRLVVQRVTRAQVEVGGRVVGKIERGLLVFVGAEVGDRAAQAEEAARKVGGLRIFEDEAGKMNLALQDAGGGVLAVPQFTLLADLSHGRRPGFGNALRGDLAQPLYDHFCAALELSGFPVVRGVFGAAMQVSLVNDGPATFVIDVPAKGERGPEHGAGRGSGGRRPELS
jgi:D-aminoacyl-tRNA deacylase